MHIIPCSLKFTLYSLLGEHSISSSQKYTLYPLHRKAHYIFFSEINIIPSSQIDTINPSQINTICPLQRCTQYIFFSDRHTISSFQYTNYIHFTEIHISSFQINTLKKSTILPLFQKCTLDPLPGKHSISSSQKYTYYPLHRNAHYILFSEMHIISSSQKFTMSSSQ